MTTRAPWAIVLAGGVGRRLSSVTGGLPKQFWAPPGQRPLLACTVDRLRPLVDPQRMITIVAADQRPQVDRLAHRSPLGHVVYQTRDRGTAAGILLGLVEVAARSPDATVIVTPSDHGVASETAWRGGLEAAMAVVDHTPNEIVLFGAEPTSAVGDYGWIEPIDDGGSQSAFGRVGVFVEKPPAAQARGLLARGAVWNTMVVVGTARRLLGLFASRVPTVTQVFAEALKQPADVRASFLAAAYTTLPASDFSADVLQGTPGLLLYTWPASTGWTDLGTPNRLEEWLGRRRRGVVRPALESRTGTSA